MCKRFSSSHCRFRLLGWSYCVSNFLFHSKSFALFLYKSGTEEVQSHPHLAENFVLELEKRPIGAYHSGGQRERESCVWEVGNFFTACRKWRC